MEVSPFPYLSAFRQVRMVLSCTGGGRAMQCQKLKTYMETGRVIFLSVKSIRHNQQFNSRNCTCNVVFCSLDKRKRRGGFATPYCVEKVFEVAF